MNVVIAFLILFATGSVFADAKVMNPGEAIGQLVYLTTDDVLRESPKYKALSPLSIPVFEELPLDMSVVAGAITLKQQSLLSHVQLKSRARGTPNLDISSVPGGFASDLLKPFPDGSWVRMLLGREGSILLEPSTEAAANAFYQSRRGPAVELKYDLSAKRIFRHAEIGSRDFDKVGSKAANYAELASALNTASRTVVRPGYAIPFFYYQEFVDSNPRIKASIEGILRDPLMNRVARVSYREGKLKALQELMRSKDAVVNGKLIDELLAIYDQERSKGLPRKMKMRSSTNSEDLPNFNGAGLYDSESFKPMKKGKEKSLEEKRASLKEVLQLVWSSVWNLRAYDERVFFQIPHAQVRMGIQVNPSFGDEGADGVVVTKNMSGDPRFPQRSGVYIEVQRGDKHSVANPQPGVKPAKILVLYDESRPLEASSYRVEILQSSNIADDGESILPHDNPNPVMTADEIKDLAYQALKADAHFKPILGADNPDFSLDLEFKVDTEDTGSRQVYVKQARPYID